MMRRNKSEKFKVKKKKKHGPDSSLWNSFQGIDQGSGILILSNKPKGTLFDPVGDKTVAIQQMLFVQDIPESNFPS